MNSNLMHSRVQLEKDILKRLVTEVRETVATDVQCAKAKKTSSFGALNLWNLRRNTRSARQVMRQPQIVTGLSY